MSLLAGLGLAAGSLFGGLLGLRSQSSANETNLQSTRETNATNLQIAAGTNLMNAALQQQQWARDDTAYQRSVKDMQAAGLNPLSGVNPQSSPLSSSMQGATMQAGHVDPLDFGFFNDFSNLLLASKQLEQNDKRIALDAISRGIDPQKINDSTANQSVIEDARNALSALANLRNNQASEAAKNANSPYVRGEGLLGTVIKDMKEAPKTGVKILDSILDSPVTKEVNKIKVMDSKTAHSQKYKPETTRRNENDYAKHVEEYYKNKAAKNHNSSGRAFGNFLRAKVFTQ